MSEEPLSKLAEAVDKATYKTLSSDQLGKSRQELISRLQKLISRLQGASSFPKVRRFLVWLCKVIIAWLSQQPDTSSTLIVSVKSVDTPTETISEPTQAPSPDVSPAIVSEPPQVSPLDASPAVVVLEPPQTPPIDKVAAALSRPEPGQIGEAEEKAQMEFSRLIETRYNYLNKQRQHRLDQAHLAFRVALISLILGIGLIFIGIVCIFFANLSVGIVTAASSIIPNVITILAFRLNKDENDRLDIVAKELGVLEKTSEAMNYIGRIEDKEARDKAIIELAQRLSS